MSELEVILRDWIDKHQISCAEAIYQVDSISRDALEIIETICDFLGYYKEGQLE